MAQTARGTRYYIATNYGADKTVTVLSNATEAVVTSVAHGFANGDIVEMTSGWGRVNLRNYRIKSVTTDTFVLEKMNTTNTEFFPTGTGLGTVRKIIAETQVTQVLATSTSGGDSKQVSYGYQENDVDFSINDGFNAVSYSLELDADSASTAGYLALLTLTEVQTVTCLHIITRKGSHVYQPTTVALNETVIIQDGQVNRVRCAINGTNRPTRY